MNIIAASQHGSIQNLLGQSNSSLNTDHQELLLANYNLPGLRIDGRMSAVRRFFCLFVTFDLLFTSLFWIICVLINGQNIFDGLSKEILHYSFKTSMFDLVVCSGCRFVLLLLFYAIIHIHHYWLVAITTLLSSAFLVTKSLLYEWNSEKHPSSYPFQVLLLLIAFLLAWSEAWFIDFSVMPQEARAKKLLRALNSSAGGSDGGRSHGGRGDGGRVRDYLSQCASESVANFYSPLQSPYESEDDDCESLAPKLTPQESVWQCLGVDAVLRAYDLLRSTGWQTHATPSPTDTITTTKTLAGKRIYKITGPLAAPAELVYRDVVEQFEAMPSWNPALTAVRRVQSLSSIADIVHQISADVPGGVIKSRDFVMVRHWRRILGGPLDNWSACWISGGLSVTHPEVPPTKMFTRGENGPGCWAFCERLSPSSGRARECTFYWVLETDLKGWIPNSVVDSAITGVMTQQLAALRERARVLVEATTCASPRVDTALAEGGRGLRPRRSNILDSSTKQGYDNDDDDELIDGVVERGPCHSLQPRLEERRLGASSGSGQQAQSLPVGRCTSDDTSFRDCVEDVDALIT